MIPPTPADKSAPRFRFSGCGSTTGECRGRWPGIPGRRFGLGSWIEESVPRRAGGPGQKGERCKPLLPRGRSILERSSLGFCGRQGGLRGRVPVRSTERRWLGRLACWLAERAGRCLAGTFRGFVSACGHAPFFSRPALGVRHGRGSAFRRARGGHPRTHLSVGLRGRLHPEGGLAPSAGAGACLGPHLRLGLAGGAEWTRSTGGCATLRALAHLAPRVAGRGAVPPLDRIGTVGTLRFALGGPPRGPDLHLDRGSGLRVRRTPPHPGWLARSRGEEPRPRSDAWLWPDLPRSTARGGERREVLPGGPSHLQGARVRAALSERDRLGI